jgi:penicillin-binding protein 1A
VYTSDGELVGEFGEMRRTPIKFAAAPTLFIKAVLAAEDDSFYHHHGVDLKSLVRAASELLTSGHIQTGGSTITMQVARNYLLSYEKTFSRKFNEILLALQIERELSKNDILELYINKIFFGNRAYGVEAAAQVYYGKSIDQLDLAQWATIAGIPKAPSANNPLANAGRALQRRNWILGRMLSLDYIDRAQYDSAIHEPIGASYHGSVLGLEAGYAAEMVRREMLDRFGPKAYTDGYVAYTTLDSKLQSTANRAVVDGLLAYSRRHGYRGPEQRLQAPASGDKLAQWQQQLLAMPMLGGLLPAAVVSVEERSFHALLGDGTTVSVAWDNGLSSASAYKNVDYRGPAPRSAADVVAVGDVVRLRLNAKKQWELRQIPAAEAALVSLQADTGAILALVGGFDYQHSKFNRATQAMRQPGSNFKPFIYTAALANGFTPATIINDAPIVFQDDQLENAWRPVNDTGKFYGPTPLRQALFKSRNVVSIRLLQQLGINTAIDYVKRFGFDTAAMPRNLSLALGSLSTTPMQIVRGFAVFANGGYRVDPYLLQRVLNRDGRVVYEAQPAIACPDCTAPDNSADSAADNGTVAQQQPAGALPVAATADAPPAAAPRAPEVVDKRNAFIMDSMLRDVVRRGTGQAASSLNRTDMGGKTGTTSGPTDAWFTGYSSGIVTTTWIGFDDNSVLGRNEYGATAALPIWMEYMKVALNGRPERHFRQPEGVVTLRIDPHTGLRARPDQNDAVFEYFTEETAPTQESGAGTAGGAAGMTEQDLF